ncbi:hypothetical protein [Wukongibacter sp. M2B1]|uniref:hypothetical protein n=1 Tax=Wukongibacter sp. M2B1 TaxID=3088895 RepID=UPI003D7955F6
MILYLTVRGSNYSDDSSATNYQTYLDFSIKATQETYKDNEPNGDTLQSGPYNLKFVDYIEVNSNVGIKNRWNNNRLYIDDVDYYTFMASKTGEVKVALQSTNTDAIRLFTKKTILTRDSNNKSNWKNTFSDEWKNNAHAWISVNNSGNTVLTRLNVNPGEVKSSIINVEAGKQYKVNVGNSFPTEYKLELSYVGVNSQSQPTVQGNETNSVVSTNYFVSGYQMLQHKEYKGALSQETTGVKMVGDTHTNGRVVNGYRDGNRIDTVDTFNVKNKTIYGAFTVYGTSYCSYTGLAVENVGSGAAVTTHHSWAE